MTEDREWKWMVGILHGLGECFWEESGGKIRKICRLMMDGNGSIGMVKGIIGGVLAGVQEIAADGVVAFSVGATDDQRKNCMSLWSPLVRPKLTLDK